MYKEKTEIKKFFNKILTPYERLIESNLMSHYDLYGHLGKILSKIDKSFSLLDLGCNNSYFISKFLKNTLIEKYTGVDIAGDTFLSAKENMSNIGCIKEFIEEDMQNFIKYNHNKFDIILLGFVFHHLNNKEKEHFIIEASKNLNDGGRIIIIDILKAEKEQDDHFTSNLIRHLTPIIQTFNEDDYHNICHHIKNYDIPGYKSLYENIAHKSYLHYSSLYTVDFYNLT